MHNHGPHEWWVSPITSKKISAKGVTMHCGDRMPEHTTGEGREEVIVCTQGVIVATVAGEEKTLRFGDSVFIPENTVHDVRCDDEEGGTYVYVVTKK